MYCTVHRTHTISNIVKNRQQQRTNNNYNEYKRPLPVATLPYVSVFFYHNHHFCYYLETTTITVTVISQQFQESSLGAKLYYYYFSPFFGNNHNFHSNHKIYNHFFSLKKNELFQWYY